MSKLMFVLFLAFSSLVDGAPLDWSESFLAKPILETPSCPSPIDTSYCYLGNFALTENERCSLFASKDMGLSELEANSKVFSGECKNTANLGKSWSSAEN